MAVNNSDRPVVLLHSDDVAKTSEEPARETYAKLHANTFGPGHQGQTSQEAQEALDEIDRLRDETEHLRAALALAESALRDQPMQAFRTKDAQHRRALAIDVSRRALGHE